MIRLEFYEEDGAVKLKDLTEAEKVFGVDDVSIEDSYYIPSEKSAIKEFNTQEECDTYVNEVALDETKKFQIREMDGVPTVYRVNKTEEEQKVLKRKNAVSRNKEIQKELREKFMDAQLKCFTDGLTFAEKYPELAIERDALLDEYNTNEQYLEV